MMEEKPTIFIHLNDFFKLLAAQYLFLLVIC